MQKLCKLLKQKEQRDKRKCVSEIEIERKEGVSKCG